jgi:hypothetical protein
VKGEIEGLRVNKSTNEAFYRRLTLPEEQKDWRDRSLERRHGFRWFASPNVVKFEDFQTREEASRSLGRSRERRHATVNAAVAVMLCETRRAEADDQLQQPQDGGSDQ